MGLNRVAAIVVVVGAVLLVVAAVLVDPVAGVASAGLLLLAGGLSGLRGST